MSRTFAFSFFLLVFLLVPQSLYAEEVKSAQVVETQKALTSIRKLKDTLRPQEEVESVSNNLASSALEDTVVPEESSENTNRLAAMLKGLGICLGVFFVGISLAKRLNPRLRVQAKSRMEIRGRLPITNKSQLVIASIDGKEVLLAVGQENLSLLDLDKNKQVERELVRINNTDKDVSCEKVLKHTA